MMMRIMMLAVFSLVSVSLSGCEHEPQSSVAELQKAWDQERLDALRMTGVVELPGNIYKRAHERALLQIDRTNMEERLAALEKEIEREREELR